MGNQEALRVGADPQQHLVSLDLVARNDPAQVRESVRPRHAAVRPRRHRFVAG